MAGLWLQMLPGITVLIFLRTDCPLSNRYAPEIQRLARAYQDRGVHFELVFPERDLTPARRGEYLSAYDYKLKAASDPDWALTRSAHARWTPEAAVFRSGKLIYHGRIDNRFGENGAARAAATEHSLSDVLAAVSQGRSVPYSFRPATGCAIADLP